MSNFTLISAAGTAYDLQDDLHVIVEAMQGIGIPEPTNIAVPYPITDGQIPQSQLYQKRDITLTCTISGASIATIHARRRALVAVLNRDVTSTWQPMRLRYSGIRDHLRDRGVLRGRPGGARHQTMAGKISDQGSSRLIHSGELLPIQWLTLRGYQHSQTRITS